MATEKITAPNKDNPESLVSSLDLFARKQEKLNQKLFELSITKLDNKEDIQEVLKFFQSEIYNEDFRHSYSAFLFVVTKIHEGGDYQEWILKENLEGIKKEIFNNYGFQDIYSPIMKLCDHISLELGRVEYNAQILSQIRINMTIASSFNGNGFTVSIVGIKFVNVSAFELKKKANSNLDVIVAVGNDIIGFVGMM